MRLWRGGYKEKNKRPSSTFNRAYQEIQINLVEFVPLKSGLFNLSYESSKLNSIALSLIDLSNDVLRRVDFDEPILPMVQRENLSF